MGWFSTDIIGGDTPFDILYEFKKDFRYRKDISSQEAISFIQKHIEHYSFCKKKM